MGSMASGGGGAKSSTVPPGPTSASASSIALMLEGVTSTISALWSSLTARSCSSREVSRPPACRFSTWSMPISRALQAIGDGVDDDNASGAALLRQLCQQQTIAACAQHQHAIAGLNSGAVDAA